MLSEINTIVSSIRLMLLLGHHAGVDVAEIVPKFLDQSLTDPEQSQFVAEAKLSTRRSARWC
jgi:hypothetical protein